MSEFYRPHPPMPEAKPGKEATTSVLHLTLGGDRTQWNSLANAIGDYIEKAIPTAEHTFQNRRAFAEKAIEALKKHGRMTLEDIPSDIAVQLTERLVESLPKTVSITRDSRHGTIDDRRGNSLTAKTPKRMVEVASMRPEKAAPTFSTDVEFQKLELEDTDKKDDQFFEDMNSAEETEENDTDGEEGKDVDSPRTSPERPRSKERREKKLKLIFYGLNELGRKKIAAIEEDHEKWKKGLQTNRPGYKGDKGEEFSKEFIQPLKEALAELREHRYVGRNFRFAEQRELEEAEQLFHQILERTEQRTGARYTPPIENEIPLRGWQGYGDRERFRKAQRAIIETGLEMEMFTESKRPRSPEEDEEKQPKKKKEPQEKQALKKESKFNENGEEQNFLTRGTSGEAVDDRTDGKVEQDWSDGWRARGNNSKNKRRGDLRDTIRGNGTN